MPVKSIREMSRFARFRYSLGTRAFGVVFILSLVLIVAAVSIGFYFYGNAVSREYRSKTWYLTRAAEGVVKIDTVKKKADKVMDIYASLPDDAKDDPNDEEYLALYDGIEDESFQDVRESLAFLLQETDAVAAYVAALDTKTNRMVYIIDADLNNETYCRPGSWDVVEEEAIDAFLHGAKRDTIGHLMGEDPMPSIPVEIERLGLRCTAGERLVNAGKYPVMVFVDTDMNKVAEVSRDFLIQYALILVLIALIIGTIVMIGLRKTVIKPLNALAGAAQGYIESKEDGELNTDHFQNLSIRTGDEIENLALTMKDMENTIEDNVRNLTKVTAEKERLNTELDVASKIQEGVVPHIFPVFPDRHEFDAYAFMRTAKEVGGDFYDIFMIDDDHLVLVMADVSGKGIPAALFMMASKIMIKNFAGIEGTSPSEILKTVNEKLCENNAAEMFVTVWLGILEVSTGKLTCSNAGHEYPAIMRKGGKFELVKDSHGFILGGMCGVSYKDYEIQLEPGDVIFEYTDGVTEATDSDMQLFGTDNMIESLDKDPSAHPDDILKTVVKDIDEFVGPAPQFDDITMLCTRYNGPNASGEKRKTPVETDEKGMES